MEMIPIGLGFLFFFAFTGGGIIYGCFIAKGKLRWFGLLFAVIGLLGLFPILMVSPPPNMSLSSLSGTYQGDYGGGTNTFVLHPNGTYAQQFTDYSSTIYHNHGTWNVGSGNVNFHHLMSIDDPDHPGKQEFSDFTGASPRWVDDAIYFDDDLDIKITRVKH